MLDLACGKMQYFGWEGQGDYGQAVADDGNRNLTFIRVAARGSG